MKTIDLDKFAPVGTKFCQGKCDRVPVKTPDGPVIVCLGCKRMVIDKRKKS